DAPQNPTPSTRCNWDTKKTASVDKNCPETDYTKACGTPGAFPFGVVRVYNIPASDGGLGTWRLDFGFKTDTDFVARYEAQSFNFLAPTTFNLVKANKCKNWPATIRVDICPTLCQPPVGLCIQALGVGAGFATCPQCSKCQLMPCIWNSDFS